MWEEHKSVLNSIETYLLEPDEPNLKLDPRWLANRLELGERDMLGALAYAVRDGLVEMHWEVYCPLCSGHLTESGSLEETHENVECIGCQTSFELHLDRDVRVTFSASQRLRRRRRGDDVPLNHEANDRPPTRGLDLLLIPAFWELFSGEAPAADESLRIGRVAILFTDLRGSTALYAQRGDPGAYHVVRDHFTLLGEAIDKHQGALVKTIGDAVMASFASGEDAVLAALDSQAKLFEHSNAMGGELVLKAGVHAGACLAVRLNERLDFFGGVVNTAARLEGLSRGSDIVVSDEVLTDMAPATRELLQVEESFDARLRGLLAPVRVHRLVSATVTEGTGRESSKWAAARFLSFSKK